MATLLETTTVRKPAPKAFRATLRDEPGALAKINGEIVFFNDVTSAIVTIEPDDCVWLCVLGEIGLTEAQKVLDTMHGGYAKIACTRAQEAA
jgi:hypothetical protein